MVDVPFSTYFPTFGFSAAGTSVSRTMSDRLAEVKNVKDFGALGNGSANDTNAIQAAINWTSSNYHGVIFFPPGEYITSSTIVLPNEASGDQQICLIGVGPLSYIHNTNTSSTGFVFDRNPDQAGNYGGWVIEKLHIKNDSHINGSGALRIQGVQGLTIQDCLFEGSTGFEIINATYCVAVYSCVFGTGGATGDTYGIVGGADVMNVIGCDVVGFNRGIHVGGPTGVAPGGTSMNIYGCRIKNNNTGVQVGTKLDGMLAGVVVEGCSFEENGISISGENVVTSRFSGITIQASSGTYGILSESQADSVWEEISIGGAFSTAAVKFGDVTRAVMLAVDPSGSSGTKWILPGGEPGTQISMLQCSYP